MPARFHEPVLKLSVLATSGSTLDPATRLLSGRVKHKGGMSGGLPYDVWFVMEARGAWQAARRWAPGGAVSEDLTATQPGSGFALLWNEAKQELSALDFNGVAPKNEALASIFNVHQARVGEFMDSVTTRGSGALAIEALSRGATRAVAVDQDAGALTAIRTNRDRIRLGDRLAVPRQPVPFTMN